MSNLFLEAHPELAEYIGQDWFKVYRRYDDQHEIIEQWQKDENGHWHDVTERVQVEIALQREIADLEKRLNYVRK